MLVCAPAPRQGQHRPLGGWDCLTDRTQGQSSRRRLHHPEHCGGGIHSVRARGRSPPHAAPRPRHFLVRCSCWGCATLHHVPPPARGSFAPGQQHAGGPLRGACCRSPSGHSLQHQRRRRPMEHQLHFRGGRLARAPRHASPAGGRPSGRQGRLGYHQPLHRGHWARTGARGGDQPHRRHRAVRSAPRLRCWSAAGTLYRRIVRRRRPVVGYSEPLRTQCGRRHWLSDCCCCDVAACSPAGSNSISSSSCSSHDDGGRIPLEGECGICSWSRCPCPCCRRVAVRHRICHPHWRAVHLRGGRDLGTDPPHHGQGRAVRAG